MNILKECVIRLCWNCVVVSSLGDFTPFIFHSARSCWLLWLFYHNIYLVVLAGKDARGLWKFIGAADPDAFTHHSSVCGLMVSSELT